MRYFMLVACAAMTVSVLSAAPSGFAQTADINGQCAANLKTEGSFMAGRRWKTSVDLPSGTQGGVVTSLGQSLATDGHWKNIQASKDIGTITAVQDIPPGTKQMPLSIVVKSAASGVTVEAILTTPPMIAASAKGVQDMVCKLLAGAGG